MQSMLDLGVTGMLEMPPAGTLTGIARRAMKGVETFALKTPDQLDDARAFVAAHGSSAQMEESPTWRLVVSPAKGTWALHDELDTGAALTAGQQIGAIRSSRDSVPVLAPHGGSIVEWLATDGDLVSPGQPLVRLHPESQS
jgi:[acyl-carrier-protein] S-malonyltransferase